MKTILATIRCNYFTLTGFKNQNGEDCALITLSEKKYRQFVGRWADHMVRNPTSTLCKLINLCDSVIMQSTVANYVQLLVILVIQFGLRVSTVMVMSCIYFDVVTPLFLIKAKMSAQLN